MMDDIQKADPELRKKLLITIAIIAVIGIILVAAVKSYLPLVSEWILENENQIGLRMKIVFMPIVTVLGLPLLIFSVYFWQLGKKIICYSQFPPPNMSVVKDTPIIRGKAACRRGQLMQVSSILLLVFVAVLITAFWKITTAFG